jgi:FKBP-type peptidyl-prolyl cis-trans isomerase
MAVGTALILTLARPTLASDENAGSAPQGATGLKSQKEKVSYALGVEVGKDFRKQSVEVDPDLFLKGLKDALSGSGTLLTEGELRLTLAELQAGLKRKQSASEAAKVLAENQLAEKNKADGDAFLAANKAREGVVTLESGLQYKILKAGDGKRPTADDEVVCQYRGTFVDGTEFDSSYKRNKPATFPLKGVIKGWTEALQLMPAGSKWQVFIPSYLAYGERGSPKTNIPPNATLVFEVELVSVQKPSPGVAKPAQKADTGNGDPAHVTQKQEQ